MKKNILTEVVRVHEIMKANTIEEQNFKIGKTVVTGEPTRGGCLIVCINHI
jgi:hypothetical protein